MWRSTIRKRISVAIAVAPGRVETNLRINSEKLAGSKTARDQSIGKWKDIEDKITEGTSRT